MKANTDHWVKDDTMFVCDGMGYVLNKYLNTICVGPVDDDGNLLRDNDLNATDTPPDGKIVVTKIEQVEFHGVNDSHEQNDGILLHQNSRGRPRKNDDEVCRMTKWRRKKELQKQGSLL